MLFLALTCLITLILIIWFKTTAFVEYNNLFRLGDLFFCQNYKDSGIDLSFPEFLVEYHNNFLTRLLSCPICLATWLGLFSIPLTGWYFPIPLVFGLFFYLIISKLL